ncbi:MAG: hypothetical protein ACERK6_04595 [Candidatus Aminicenantaceae bacterium]
MQLIRFWIFPWLICFLACTSSGRSPEVALGMHYRAEVEIEPDQQYMGCDVSLRFLPPDDGGVEAVFFLHRQFKIEKVSGKGISGYTFDVDSESPLGFMPAELSLRLTSYGFNDT